MDTQVMMFLDCKLCHDGCKNFCKINQCIDLAILVSQYGINTSQAVLQALVLVQRTLAPVLALHHALTQRMSQCHAV